MDGIQMDDLRNALALCTAVHHHGPEAVARLLITLDGNEIRRAATVLAVWVNASIAPEFDGDVDGFLTWMGAELVED